MSNPGFCNVPPLLLLERKDWERRCVGKIRTILDEVFRGDRGYNLLELPNRSRMVEWVHGCRVLLRDSFLLWAIPCVCFVYVVHMPDSDGVEMAVVREKKAVGDDCSRVQHVEVASAVLRSIRSGKEVDSVQAKRM